MTGGVCWVGGLVIDGWIGVIAAPAYERFCGDLSLDRLGFRLRKVCFRSGEVIVE